MSATIAMWLLASLGDRDPKWCPMPHSNAVQEELCAGFSAEQLSPVFLTPDDLKTEGQRFRSFLWTSWRDKRSRCLVGQVISEDGTYSFFGYAVGTSQGRHQIVSTPVFLRKDCSPDVKVVLRYIDAYLGDRTISDADCLSDACRVKLVTKDGEVDTF